MQNQISYTLIEWLNEWLETYKAPHVQAGTLSVYRETIQRLSLCECADMPLETVDERHIQRALNEMAHRRGKPYSKSIMKKAMYTLSASLKYAKRLGIISSNPCDLDVILLPKSPTKKVLPLTHAEQERLEMVCRCDPLGHVIIFLLRTGLRRGELLNLKWEDYDDSSTDGAVYIHIQKSKTPAGERPVWLINEAKRIVDAQPRNHDFIFSTMRGTPLTISSLKKAVERIRKAAHLPSFALHVCRHTFVTRLCEKNQSAKTIAKIIGHAHTGYVLDIYASLEDDASRKGIFALDVDDGSANNRNIP